MRRPSSRSWTPSRFRSGEDHNTEQGAAADGSARRLTQPIVRRQTPTLSEISDALRPATVGAGAPASESVWTFADSLGAGEVDHAFELGRVAPDPPIRLTRCNRNRLLRRIIRRCNAANRQNQKCCSTVNSSATRHATGCGHVGACKSTGPQRTSAMDSLARHLLTARAEGDKPGLRHWIDAEMKPSLARVQSISCRKPLGVEMPTRWISSAGGLPPERLIPLLIGHFGLYRLCHGRPSMTWNI
ncbi:hypothetical protein MYIN104542_27985 [Mycobacterium intermedium]